MDTMEIRRIGTATIVPLRFPKIIKDKISWSFNSWPPG